MLIRLLVLLSEIHILLALAPCAPKDFGHGSTVCVCNSTYCDKIEPVGNLDTNQAVVYQSNANGKRLERTVIEWQTGDVSQADLKIDDSKVFQSIIGFGGAFTDSATTNIAKLSKPTQEALFSSYYSSENGIGYSTGRVPIASCDYSPSFYSYDDTPGDFNLTKFALNGLDLNYKIPAIKKALQYSDGKLLLFGSPWSPPAWMKTNKQMKGQGGLIGQPGGNYYKAWAYYFVRFLQEYAKQGVNFWGLTAQNEPSSGFLKNYKWQTCGFTPQQQRDFVKMDLGPMLHKYGYSDVKLMIHDDQRLTLPGWPQVVLSDPEASKYVSGTAVHWYWDHIFTDPWMVAKTHELFPNHFILYSEACNPGPPIYGNWTRAELYAHNIIQDLNNWVSGWTDWNMALDLKGGPRIINSSDDAPILIDTKNDQFFKQPMFYALGHFSKFLPTNSVRIGMEFHNSAADLVQAAAFETPANLKVLVLSNRDAASYSVSVSDLKKAGKVLKVTLESHSIKTVMWKS